MFFESFSGPLEFPWEANGHPWATFWSKVGLLFGGSFSEAVLEGFRDGLGVSLGGFGTILTTVR